MFQSPARNAQLTTFKYVFMCFYKMEYLKSDLHFTILDSLSDCALDVVNYARRDQDSRTQRPRRSPEAPEATRTQPPQPPQPHDRPNLRGSNAATAAEGLPTAKPGPGTKPHASTLRYRNLCYFRPRRLRVVRRIALFVRVRRRIALVRSFIISAQVLVLIWP
ncbi:hypothetical protein L596_020711 [Steinernema carpocapsae]|uniref:Uncharacterized protein n=1 Tax=Steinernema carpocapsae TaxID=34508 RepID=A0A4U5MUD3_STECR|nr:hypothetical protein L596_020711 [Steinernema carpocapsae]